MENSQLKSAVDISNAATIAESLRKERRLEVIDNIRSILSSIGTSFDQFASDFQGIVRFAVTNRMIGIFHTREESDMFVTLMWRAIRLDAREAGEAETEKFADLDAAEVAAIRNVAETLRELAKLHEKHAASSAWYATKKNLETKVADAEERLRDAKAIAECYGSREQCDERFFQTLVNRPDQWPIIGQLADLHNKECAISNMMPRVVDEMVKRWHDARAALESFLKKNPQPS